MVHVLIVQSTSYRKIQKQNAFLSKDNIFEKMSWKIDDDNDFHLHWTKPAVALSDGCMSNSGTMINVCNY